MTFHAPNCTCESCVESKRQLDEWHSSFMALSPEERKAVVDRALKEGNEARKKIRKELNQVLSPACSCQCCRRY